MRKFAYTGVLALTCLLALAISWTAFGHQIDNNAYDFFFRLHQPAPWTPESIILAADEQSFSAYGGLRGLRAALAAALLRIRAASPKAVAVDVILADANEEASDSALESAFRETPNLVLPCDLIEGGSTWEDPLPRFRRHAAAVGQVHAELDSYDAISRELPLEKVAGNDRRWALALEAFRVSRHAEIIESPNDLHVAGITIPAAAPAGRTMRIRYFPGGTGGIPRISFKQLADNPGLVERFRGKVVFAGVTAQTAVRDRWMTPLSNSVVMPGVEFHANAFETIARAMFLTNAPLWSVVLVCIGFTAVSGITYSRLEGWRANAAALGILLAAHILPFLFFERSIVFPYLPATAAAWFAIVTAAAWRHVVVRRQLGQSESAHARYQHAMQFVTHEMKTPLTAIQGSSELISRYAMPEEKRKQMADLINMESKRLGTMIETFLNVERLSAGQIALKHDRFSASEVMARCIERVRPIADRKSIEVRTLALPPDCLTGDRELMEYAFYNLLNNAVKYSPANTTVSVSGERLRDRLRVTVADQGIGIDPKDSRRIFEKFYRTRTAEESGEKGTGVGLSIVEQIVVQHGGAITVESEVGKGSKFTVSLPVR